MANWTAVRVTDIRAMYPELSQSAVDADIIERQIPRAENYLRPLVRPIWGDGAAVAADPTIVELVIWLTAAFTYMTVQGQRAFGGAEPAIRTARFLIEMVEKYLAQLKKEGALSVPRVTAVRVASNAQITEPVYDKGRASAWPMPDGNVNPRTGDRRDRY